MKAAESEIKRVWRALQEVILVKVKDDRAVCALGKRQAKQTCRDRVRERERERE